MENDIKQKAEYCLNCKNPQCRTGCPLENNIPAFIQKVKEDNLEEAYKILQENNYNLGNRAEEIPIYVYVEIANNL